MRIEPPASELEDFTTSPICPIPHSPAVLPCEDISPIPTTPTAVPLAPPRQAWPPPRLSTPFTRLCMSNRPGSYFHLHLVSDATGETLITVARAAAAQYVTVTPIEHIYPLVRSQRQLDRVLNEVEAAPGIVLYTLLDRELLERLETKCRKFQAHRCAEFHHAPRRRSAHRGPGTCRGGSGGSIPHVQDADLDLSGQSRCEDR